MKRKILVIEADNIKYDLLKKYLTDLNYSSDSISRCLSLKESLAIPAENADVILADLYIDNTNSLSALQTLHSHFINIPLIVLMDTEDTDIDPVQQPLQGYLVYGSYDSAQLGKAISHAKEHTARLANMLNKELHAVIQEQKAQLDSILFSINDAIWSRNAETLELTYANNAYYKLYGYAPEEMQPNKHIIMGSIYADDRDKFMTALETVRTTGNAEIIYRHVHQDGSVKTLRAKSTLKKGVAGGPDTISGVTVDITKETALHEEIRNTEQKLLATINNTKDLIWSVNKNLEIIFCNKPYQDFIYSLGGVLPQPGNFVLGDWGSESFINHRTKDYERALSGESFTTIVEEVYKGEVMYNEISSNPIIDHDGNIIGVNCIARDISQQKKQFFKIREQNEKLREIAWIQSHKVRGPVSSILGLASLLDYESMTNEHTVDIIKKLKQVTNDLDDIIKEVVDSTIDVDYTYTDADIINSRQ